MIKSDIVDPSGVSVAPSPIRDSFHSPRKVSQRHCIGSGGRSRPELIESEDTYGLEWSSSNASRVPLTSPASSRHIMRLQVRGISNVLHGFMATLLFPTLIPAGVHIVGGGCILSHLQFELLSCPHQHSNIRGWGFQPSKHMVPWSSWADLFPSHDLIT